MVIDIPIPHAIITPFGGVELGVERLGSSCHIQLATFRSMVIHGLPAYEAWGEK